LSHNEFIEILVLVFYSMSWNKGINDAGEAVVTALKFFIIIAMLITIMGAFENMDPEIKIDFALVKQSVGLIVTIIVLLGVLSGLVVFLKAVDNPWWGIGYLMGLVLLVPFAYIVAQTVSSSVNVGLPESAISIVDMTSEINLVSIGVVIGFVLLVIIVVYKLMEKMYSY